MADGGQGSAGGGGGLLNSDAARVILPLVAAGASAYSPRYGGAGARAFGSILSAQDEMRTEQMRRAQMQQEMDYKQQQRDAWQRMGQDVIQAAQVGSPHGDAIDAQGNNLPGLPVNGGSLHSVFAKADATNPDAIQASYETPREGNDVAGVNRYIDQQNDAKPLSDTGAKMAVMFARGGRPDLGVDILKGDASRNRLSINDVGQAYQNMPSGLEVSGQTREGYSFKTKEPAQKNPNPWTVIQDQGSTPEAKALARGVLKKEGQFPPERFAPHYESFRDSKGMFSVVNGKPERVPVGTVYRIGSQGIEDSVVTEATKRAMVLAAKRPVDPDNPQGGTAINWDEARANLANMDEQLHPKPVQPAAVGAGDAQSSDRGSRTAPPALSHFAVNPKTGQRIGWDGTKWVSAPR